MAWTSPGERNQENLLERAALRNLNLKIKCPRKTRTKITTACHLLRKANAQEVF